MKICGNWKSRGSSLCFAGIIVPFATTGCIEEEQCFQTGLAGLEKPVTPGIQLSAPWRKSIHLECVFFLSLS